MPWQSVASFSTWSICFLLQLHLFIPFESFKHGIRAGVLSIIRRS
ncbi:hypothetical protein ES332_A01G241500v1 [Gossypium tomentosum]|uniref:Uncharacterized protein n=1 Tax=Gossypium tomentosum TaxID=34277 RepID=A0A5D2RX09_GOSTO|nr:hypothetical protein ES332_A01G241500v1 [Gossypium tomentosum]